MSGSDFLQIRQVLRAMYKNIIETPVEIEAWQESFRRYDFDTIKTACISYYNGASGQYYPKPFNILELLPRADSMELNLAPRYEMVNGVRTRAYNCLRCKDTGLITWTDENGCIYGKSCRCMAGKIKYPWSHLTREEQMEYVKKNGSHGETIGERCV